ncbi:MAG TPA: hypothetical protein VEI83_10350 [Acidimicrobiales bacterium]|nr:hypothetical protein [Acidimicrobiales bacterium]
MGTQIGTGVAGEVPAVVPWRTRVDWALSSGLAAVAAQESSMAARRALEARQFDELRHAIAGTVMPVLEACARAMRGWGLTVNVGQVLRDTPVRMPRGYDLVLTMERFDGRGPGRLTITAIEGREVLRVVMRVGPGHMGGDASEHDAVVHVHDLTEDMVGGLVATMVECVLR